jgi:hypothetical protein
LGYDPVSNRFVARLMNGTGAVIAQAQDALPVMNPLDPTQPLQRAGSWVYLAMAYDAAAGTLRLDAQSTAVIDPPESAFSAYQKGAAVPVSGTPAVALGAFNLGAGTIANGDRAAWEGPVDNVAVWQGLPDPDTTLLRNANYQR